VELPKSALGIDPLAWRREISMATVIRTSRLPIETLTRFPFVRGMGQVTLAAPVTSASATLPLP
jgi:hypothetical protein